MLPGSSRRLDEYEVVPWRSREEWLQVCHLICSNDLPKWQEAYEKLRCWKARCHRLPAGVECTLMILEPMLVEQNLRDTNNEFAIKSVYALAITRFLNTAASFDKEKVPTTLYKIAHGLSIPEWIVNIRHEAAHSPDLPSLDVLCAGVQFSMQWLISVYWEKGLVEDQPESDEVSKYDLRDKLLKWCEIYQGLYLHSFKDIHLTEDIKDQKFMQKVKNYYLGGDSHMSIDEEDSDISDELPSKLNDLMDQLVMRLNSVYYEAVKNKWEVKKILKCFLQVSEFLPSKTTLQNYTSTRDDASQGLTSHLRKMWTRVIKDVFQSQGALLQFMTELVDYNSGDTVKDLISAFWVRDIAKGIILAQVALQVGGSMGVSSAEANYYTIEQEMEIYQRAKTRHRNLVWGNAMRLSLNNIPTTDGLVEKVILSPKKYTKIYLADLMETTKRKLSENRKQKIMKYVDLILNQTCYVGDNVNSDGKIYIMIKPSNECNGVEEPSGTSNSDSTSIWREVPFGCLPEINDFLKN